jgi:negative regulator of sigma E activity
MSQNKPVDLHENLSALIDGEVSEWDVRKTLQQIGDNNDLRDEWASYQRIGSILRKEPGTGGDISSAVMSAIADEPAHSRFTQFKKPFSQAVLAASVAAVALFGIQQYQVAQTGVAGGAQVAEGNMQTDMPLLVQPPAGFEFQPVSRPVSSSTSQPSLRTGTTVEIPVDRDQMRAHLESLAQDHSEHAVHTSQGVLPMVRVPAPTEAE